MKLYSFELLHKTKFIFSPFLLHFLTSFIFSGQRIFSLTYIKRKRRPSPYAIQVYHNLYTLQEKPAQNTHTHHV